MTVASQILTSLFMLIKLQSINISRVSTRRIMNLTKSDSKKDQAFTVFVEGNIGSGKTSFLQHFSKHNVLLLAEPVEAWRNIKGHNFLDLMYKDPMKWGLAFQSIVQKTMLDLHLRTSHEPIKMMERSIFSARYVFVENLHRTQKLSSPDYTVLDEWFQWITKNLHIKGDLTVYLRTDPEVVYKRIKARARPEEAHVPLEYLKQLHLMHEDWLYHKVSYSCPAPVIIVDANKDLPNMLEEYKKCELEIASNGYQIGPAQKNIEISSMIDAKINKIVF
uniref:Deoxynucleoside kinase domain-containing protein n=1 Tax=Clastoptera arizonana TaxID=38151 RepID=A0A1B6C1H1_9HEMI